MKKTLTSFSIVWVGYHVEGKLALEGIVESGIRVSAVITLDAESALIRSGVWEIDDFCAENDIALHKIKNINEDEVVELLKDLEPSVLCVIGWSQVLKKPVLDCARFVVGAHASLLPRNRGSAPINWALIKGEEITGNTLMILSEGVDSGDIVAQRSFEISLFDSCKTLYDKVADTNADMLLEFLNRVYEDNVQLTKQPETGEEILPRRRPRDGLIEWNQHSKDVYNFIRALTRPYPGAYTFKNHEQLILWNVSWSPVLQFSGAPGTVSAVRYSYIDELCAVDINCSSGCISIHEMELANGKLLRGKALVDFFTHSEGFEND